MHGCVPKVPIALKSIWSKPYGRTTIAEISVAISANLVSEKCLEFIDYDLSKKN